MEHRYRRYVATMHNYHKEQWTKEKLIKILTSLWLIDYVIIGEEITEDNSIPHYQIYIEFTNQTTQQQVIERFAKITQLKPHVESAKGDSASNKIYCSKSQNFLEHGKISEKLKAEDIATNVVDLLVNGLTLIEILIECPSYSTYIIRNFKNLQDVQNTIKLTEHKPKIDDGDLPF
jgi:hypothetical protein